MREIATFALALMSVPAAGQELERDRQEQLCAGMQINRYLPNGTYVDCVIDDYAIEVDFSNKWAEAIGQSLMYAAELERLPGIILICHRDTDPSLCLKHGYLIEQTVNWWRIFEPTSTVCVEKRIILATSSRDQEAAVACLRKASAMPLPKSWPPTLLLILMMNGNAWIKTIPKTFPGRT